MRSCRTSRASAQGNRLSLLHMLSDTHQQLAVMSVPRESSIRMADDNVITVPTIIRCLNDRSRTGCIHCRSYRARPIHALHNARRARRLPHVRSALRKNALIHTLLCLPPILLPPLAPYLHLRAMLTGHAMEDLQLLYVFFQAGMVSGGVIYIAAGLFLLLYLPFLPYRKLRNAAVVVNAYADVR